MEEQLSNVTIVGSVGIDTIETPYGKVADGLGGSAVYAALAALSVSRRAARVAIVSVVGDDFPEQHRNFLLSQKIVLDGLVTVGAPTFRWHGSYEYDMGVAKTLKTDLGSLALADQVKSGYQRIVTGLHTPGVRSGGNFLLLANFDPEVQLEIVRATRKLLAPRPQTLATFVVLDTMNFWIKNKVEHLRSVIKRVDALLLNENEARELLATPNLVKAGHLALELGPAYVIIKKGEHGSMLFSEHGFFAVPGYPLLEPVDPTGAGDSFAGALVGYLAQNTRPLGFSEKPTLRVNYKDMCQAVVYATAVSSFTVEGMGTSHLTELKQVEIEERVDVFRQMRQF